MTLVCGVLVAACGSSGPSTNNPPSYSQLLSFSKCMRARGVSSYPDPSTSGGGLHIHIAPGMGIDPQAPAYRAAHTSCRHLLPSGQPSAQASAQAKAQLLGTAECMRAHGITDFPDPQSGSPPTGGNFSATRSLPGAFLAVPSSINTQSPAFTHAAAVCSFGP